MATVLTPEQEQECRKLKALFDERAGMSQRAFVKKYNLGTPANLGQYLLGRRPLTLGDGFAHRKTAWHTDCGVQPPFGCRT